MRLHEADLAEGLIRQTKLTREVHHRVKNNLQTVSALRERFPSLSDPPSDDICYATQNRQVAVKAMAPQCELVIVVGSKNSSNSVRLVEVALQAGAKDSHLSTTRARSTRRGCRA